jgi:hypothetical protein
VPKTGSLEYVGRVSLPPDANRIRPDDVPTPFSATDIRAGCPLGRTIQLQSETPAGELTYRRIRFVEVDAEGAVQEFQSTDARGLPTGEPTRRRSSWLEFQQHASQPAAATVIDEVELALPFGTEACWRYTVGAHDECVRFWFAKGRAGMPVQVERQVGGELVSRSVVIADEVA